MLTIEYISVLLTGLFFLSITQACMDLFYSFEKPKQRRKHWAVFLSVDLRLIPPYPYLADPSQGCMQMKKAVWKWPLICAPTAH